MFGILFSHLFPRSLREKKKASDACPAPAPQTPVEQEPAASAPEVKKTAEPAVNAAPGKAPEKAAPKKADPAKKQATPKKAEEPAKVDDDPAPARLPFATTPRDVQNAFDSLVEESEEQIRKNALDENAPSAVGKFEFSLEPDGFHFILIANNGQVLFESPSFTTLLGAIGGVRTFKKTVSDTEFALKKDKYDRYRFILANKYYGENYSTKEQCLKCVESVKKFANNSHVIFFRPDADSLEAFEAAKALKRTVGDVDWAVVKEQEEAAAKFGKFEICREDGEFCFYLLANNGEILYSSRYYSNETTCRKGIESFKRAAYVGNFFVDPDKFGNYRFVLKNIGSAPAFIGESYDNKPQCERVIDSVKKFIVTASVEMEAENE